ESYFLELLKRHNTVMTELLQRRGGPTQRTLLLVVPTWGTSNRPASDSLDIVGLGIEGVYWLSVTEDDETWTHQYVAEVTWRDGCLDELLRRVATDEASGV